MKLTVVKYGIGYILVSETAKINVGDVYYKNNQVICTHRKGKVSGQTAYKIIGQTEDLCHNHTIPYLHLDSIRKLSALQSAKNTHNHSNDFETYWYVVGHINAQKEFKIALTAMQEFVDYCEQYNHSTKTFTNNFKNIIQKLTQMPTHINVMETTPNTPMLVSGIDDKQYLVIKH